MFKRLKFGELFLICSIIMFAADQNIGTSAMLAGAGIWNIIDAIGEIKKVLSKD